VPTFQTPQPMPSRGHRLTAISLSDGTLNSAAAFSIAVASSGASTAPILMARSSLRTASHNQYTDCPLNLCRHEKLRLPWPQVQRREPEDRY
jgi:hypothetical protein